MRAVLVVVDSSIKKLDHNLKACNINDIVVGAVTLAEIEGVSSTMLKHNEFDTIVLHSKELELEETEFGKALTKPNGKLDLGLIGVAINTVTEHFLIEEVVEKSKGLDIMKFLDEVTE